MSKLSKNVALVIEDSELLKKVEQIVHAVDGVNVSSYGNWESYLSNKTDSVNNLLILEKKAVTSRVEQIEEVGKTKTIFLIEDKTESVTSESIEYKKK